MEHYSAEAEEKAFKLLALQARQAAEARFRVVFEQAPLGVTLVEAAKNVQPVAKSAAESIAALRAMSDTRGYLDANRGGHYRRGPVEASTERRRSINRAK